EVSIATALSEGGYQTWHVGKWHLGDDAFYPEKHGFDVNVGGRHWGMPHKGYFSPYGLANLDDGPEGEYLTDRLTDEAIQLIEKRDTDKPFFLNMSHYAVHTPIQAPAELIAKYEEKAKAMGLDTQEAIIEGEHFPCEHKMDQRIQRRIIQSDPTYAAMIENLDSNIGRLLQALQDSGIEEETLVFFTADNGGLSTAEGSPTCNAPLVEGKGWMYEGGTRVCQIAKWPGKIKAGTQTAVPVTSTDFYATMLEAAELPLRPEQHTDGISMMPLLKGAEQLDREAIFWHYPHYGNQGGTPGASIRSGDWKLIEFYEDNHLELYNLKEDISEEHNLADVEVEKERAQKMHQDLDVWRISVEAKIPERNPDWKEPEQPGKNIDSAYI
ncbi:MAG: sulfatase, partial [Planctomycetes bacterium]|nr:sulfatase [Planctomycetota bacterium]